MVDAYIESARKWQIHISTSVFLAIQSVIFCLHNQVSPIQTSQFNRAWKFLIATACKEYNAAYLPIRQLRILPS